MLAVEADAVELAFERARFAGHVIDFVLFLIQARQAGDFPFAVGDLRFLAAIATVEIEVKETITLTAPEKLLAVSEKTEQIIDVDPVWVLLGENGPGVAGQGIGEDEVQPVLDAVEPLHGQRAGIRGPIHAG